MTSHSGLFLKRGHFEFGNSIFTASAINEPTLGFSDFFMRCLRFQSSLYSDSRLTLI